MFNLNSRLSGLLNRGVPKLSTFIVVLFAVVTVLPWVPYEWITAGEQSELLGNAENRLELLAVVYAERVADGAEPGPGQAAPGWLRNVPHTAEVQFSTRAMPAGGMQGSSQPLKPVAFRRNGQIGADVEIPSRGLIATASQSEADALATWRERGNFGLVVLVFRTIAAILIGLILFYGIRSREKTRAELIRTQQLALSATRAKTEFLARMSHELRTPLNAIIGFSEAIKLAIFGPIESRYREYGAHIHASGAHLLRLVNDVLDVSKLEAGRFELEESEIDLVELIESTMRLIQRQAETAGVKILRSGDPVLPRVSGDARRLQQAILNLLSNAVKFTPRGGDVRVAVQEAGGGILIRISDTGVGIPEDQIPVALEPFRQVNAPVRAQASGTGLGLPIARDLVELHGGKLTIESVVDQGTTVSIQLPAARILPALSAPAIPAIGVP